MIRPFLFGLRADTETAWAPAIDGAQCHDTRQSAQKLASSGTHHCSKALRFSP
jgi:hypothetical protein